MKTPLVEYPNAHATNPYYSNPLRGKPADMNAAIACGLFANAMADNYRVLNARLAERHEAELVSLCPELPAIPSRGPEFPSIKLPDGGIQYILPDVG